MLHIPSENTCFWVRPPVLSSLSSSSTQRSTKIMRQLWAQAGAGEQRSFRVAAQLTSTWNYEQVPAMERGGLTSLVWSQPSFSASLLHSTNKHCPSNSLRLCTVGLAPAYLSSSNRSPSTSLTTLQLHQDNFSIYVPYNPAPPRSLKPFLLSLDFSFCFLQSSKILATLPGQMLHCYIQQDGSLTSAPWADTQ